MGGCARQAGAGRSNRRFTLLCRYGELEQRWVAYDNWTFSLEFELPPALLEEAALVLHLGAVDTGKRGRLAGWRSLGK